MQIFVDNERPLRHVEQVSAAPVSADRSQRPWTQVSVSQVSAFLDCQRIWYNRSILGKRQPTQDYQQAGLDIHKLNEHYLKTGEILPGEHAARTRDASRFLPAPGTATIEQYFEMPTFEGGPKLIGYKDCVSFTDPALPEVVDHKSTSSFRYCKTPAELVDNVQLVVYALDTMIQAKAQACKIVHVYIKTKVKTPQSARVEAVVTLEQARNFYETRVLPVVRQMAEWARTRPATADELPPTTSMCDKYRGCFYKTDCGFVSVTSLTGGSKNMAQTMTLKERLLAAKAAQTGTVVAPAAQPAVPTQQPVTVASAHIMGVVVPATGVLPPDAPSRLTTQADVDAEAAAKAPATAQAAPKTRGRKPKAEVSVKLETPNGEQEVAPEGPPMVNPAPATASVAPTVAAEPPRNLPPRQGKCPKVRPAIWVDSMFTKGAPADSILFEDWLAPVARMAAEVAQLPDYGLIDYKSRAILASCMLESLDTVPANVYVSSQTRGAEVFLEIITPHAASISYSRGR